MTYKITRDYIKKGNARSGHKINTVRFIVSHDIGDGESTAHNNRDYFNDHQPSASAHTFIDDKNILEIVPLDEKAWHVQYQKTIDNKLFGDDANDCAIGVELCHGGNINFKEAYDRYVWYHAYLCKMYALNPYKDIVGHYTLDPERRSDPINAFKPNGITWDRFISDVVNQLNSGDKPVIETVEAPKTEVKTEIVTKPSISNLLRKGDKGPEVKTLQKKLIAAGFKLPKYGADSDFGDETEAAVKAFQKAVGITVDGIAGPVTFSKIDSYKKPTSKSKAIVPYPGKLIKKGLRGNDVKRIQRALGIKADGIFGTKTEAAVKAYQKRHGLKVDGLVGKNTWNMMF